MHSGVKIKCFLFLVVAVILIANTEAFFFEPSEDFFNLNNHITSSEDEINYQYIPLGRTTETRAAEDALEEDLVDLERDLKLSEIESIIIIFLVLFGIIIIAALLFSLKKASELVFILGTVAIILVLTFLAFNFFLSRSIMGDIYGRTDSLWMNISAERFDASDVGDINFAYSREIVPTDLNRIFSFPNSYLGSIDTIIQQIWQDQIFRESFVIEFENRDKAVDFIDDIFIEESSTTLRRGSYQRGTFRTNDDNYRKGYVMNDNRFVFLVFSEEAYSDNLFNHYMNFYPSQYSIRDSTPPRIDIISQTVTNINEIIFKVSDRNSGINQLQILIPGTEFNPISDCRKNNNVRFDEFICAFRDLKEGKNSIIIVARDREKNNARKTVEYVFDTENPVINVIDLSSRKANVRITDNYAIDISGITLIVESRFINTRNYCRKNNNVINCEFPIDNKITTISATDNAGNNVQKQIEVDLEEPVLELVNPKNKFSNDGNLEFFIADDGSEIKTISIKINDKQENICSRVTSQRYRCRYSMNEEINKILVVAEDNSGNVLEYENKFIYDSKKPVIILLSYSNDVVDFTVRDEISGINEDWIIINGNNFYMNDICERLSNYYRCSTRIGDINSIEIRVSDKAGNVNNFVQVLNT